MAKVTVSDDGWTDLGVASDLLVQRSTSAVVEIVRADEDPGAEASDIGALLWAEDPHIAFAPNADETRHAWARSRAGAAELRVI